jgi:hypothetical protein
MVIFCRHFPGIFSEDVLPVMGRKVLPLVPPTSFTNGTLGLGNAENTGTVPGSARRPSIQTFMKYNETQKYGTYLRKLSTEEIDKLLSSLLQEMRRRDSDHVKGDVVANSKALHKLSSTDGAQAA